MIRCHPIARLLLTGLICLLVPACNWQPAEPPILVTNVDESVDDEIDVTPQTPPDEPDLVSPSDESAEPDDPRTVLRPYYEWTESETAADALGRMGPAAVPSLVEALRDPNPEVRFLASRVIARIGPDAVIAVPDLIELLQDDDEQVRRAATRALGQIGPAAAESVPELIRLLQAAESADSSAADPAVEP